MSNSTVNFIEESLSKSLGTTPRSTMSGYVNDYSNSSPAIQRHLAVATALELIKADVSGSTENKSASFLADHMEYLSRYADVIQSALKIEE